MKTKLKLRHESNYKPPICPYFDTELKICARAGCYRMKGCECSYKNQMSRKKVIAMLKMNHARKHAERLMKRAFIITFGGDKHES